MMPVKKYNLQGPIVVWMLVLHFMMSSHPFHSNSDQKDIRGKERLSDGNKHLKLSQNISLLPSPHTRSRGSMCVTNNVWVRQKKKIQWGHKLQSVPKIHFLLKKLHPLLLLLSHTLSHSHAYTWGTNKLVESSVYFSTHRTLVQLEINFELLL